VHYRTVGSDRSLQDIIGFREIDNDYLVLFVDLLSYACEMVGFKSQSLQKSRLLPTRRFDCNGEKILERKYVLYHWKGWRKTQEKIYYFRTSISPTISTRLAHNIYKQNANLARLAESHVLTFRDTEPPMNSTSSLADPIAQGLTVASSLQFPLTGIPSISYPMPSIPPNAIHYEVISKILYILTVFLPD